MSVTVTCNGCNAAIKDVLQIPIEGKMRPLMYAEPSNLRNPRDAALRFSAQTFHWCDKCSAIAVRAVEEANK